jgi:hypothetical protein
MFELGALQPTARPSASRHHPSASRETSIVEALDVLWHLLNFFAPALGISVIAASAAKLLWHRELAVVAWQRLVVPAGLAGMAVLLAGLVLLGRDGRMPTYGALVVANAVSLWWRGFGPGRR